MWYQAVSAQSTAWRQIIGVVGDARNNGVDQPVIPAIYIPQLQSLQVHCSGCFTLMWVMRTHIR